MIKRLCVFFFLFVSMQIGYSQNSNNNFKLLIELFKNKSVPISIYKDSLGYYGELIPCATEKRYNIYKTINKEFINYLPIYKLKDESLLLRYWAIFNLDISSNFYTILFNRELYRIDPENAYGTGDCLILCNYDKNGNLIDSISFAGYIFEDFEQYGKISKDKIISTRRVEFTSDYNGYGGIETIKEFVINEAGKFICKSNTVQKGRIKLEEDKSGSYFKLDK